MHKVENIKILKQLKETLLVFKQHQQQPTVTVTWCSAAAKM